MPTPSSASLNAPHAALGIQSQDLQPENSTSCDPKSESSQSLEALVGEIAVAVNSAVSRIRRVNGSSHMLALNARIEAARAGTYGAAFGVVASEMQDLASSTADVAETLAVTTNNKITDLLALIGTSIRGTRLSDLALTNIDLIDRCLYERTCDVRWWATDSSLTDALREKSGDAYSYASQRLGVILSAYTVYHDLVLCDPAGQVVANGRPEKFSSVGQDCSKAPWFRSAISTQSGDEYGFQTAHESKLAGGLPSLVYSCTVREGGHANGEVLGVLGILFDWSSLAAPILRNLPIQKEELLETECYITDRSGQVLASKTGQQVATVLRIPEFSRVTTERKGFYLAEYQGRRCCIAHAESPGFETYSTGWYSIIIQPSTLR